MEVFRELWGYIRTRRNWILAPLFVFLVLLGFLIIFAETSVFAPIVYTLF